MDALPNPKRVKITSRFAEDIERDIPYDPEPIGRYNVAPGTKVLLLSERDEHLHLIRFSGDMLPDGGINRR